MRPWFAVLVFCAIGLAPTTSAAQGAPTAPPPPVGPIAPQIETPSTLREALGSITQSPSDLAWARMSARQRQDSVVELKSILDRLREQAGLPVAPPAPPADPAPAPVPPPPGSKDEFDVILRGIDEALATLTRSSPTAAVSEAAKLRQAFTKLKAFAP